MLDLVYWWNTDDLYAYASFALAVHVHVAAAASDMTLTELCRRVAARHAIVL